MFNPLGLQLPVVVSYLSWVLGPWLQSSATAANSTPESSHSNSCPSHGLTETPCLPCVHSLVATPPSHSAHTSSHCPRPRPPRGNPAHLRLLLLISPRTPPPPPPLAGTCLFSSPMTCRKPSSGCPADCRCPANTAFPMVCSWAALGLEFCEQCVLRARWEWPCDCVK